jgi:hypothetical protein
MSALVPVRRGQPSLEDVHISGTLSNIGVAYFQTTQDFIYPNVFPILDVEHKKDNYWTWPSDAWLRDEARKRAPHTESAGSGFELSTDSYNADVWAFHKDLDNQTLANADDGLNLEEATVNFVSSRLALRQERQWAADFFKTGVWGTDYAGVASGPTGNQFLRWDDVASDPEADLDLIRERSLTSTGLENNTLVIGYQAYRKLRRHPDFKERLKYTSTESVTLRMLEEFLEIDRILIAKAVVNTAPERATKAVSFIFGKSAWFGHVAANPGRLTPSAGYTFRWTGVSGGLGLGAGVATIPVPLTKSTRYEMEVAFDNKAVAPDLGVFIENIVG